MRPGLLVDVPDDDATLRAEEVMEDLEKFDSTIVIPGFGAEAIPAARAVQHVIEKASEKGLHVQSVTVARGQLVLRGDAEAGRLKEGIKDLSREVWEVVRAARLSLSTIAQAPALPRSMEG